MPDLLVRDLSETTHTELKRRAEADGVSLQVYVTRVLEDHTDRLSPEEWHRRWLQLRPIEASGAEWLEAARAELP